MPYRAVCVSKNPIEYFLQKSDEGPRLRVSDVVVRANQSKTEIFSQLIRFGTNSHWSHSALFYLINDPPQGFDNTFLVEAWTTGVRVASWRNEVIPFEQFTVGIKRPKLDWYVETPREKAIRHPDDPEDVLGIDYLRHVRGMALDQINGLYDNASIYQLSALFAERLAKQYLSEFPQVAQAAASVAATLKQWNESDDPPNSIWRLLYTFFTRLGQPRTHNLAHPANRNAALRFICSGLVQYSFFAAFRWRILNDMAIPGHRDAAMSNLSNLHRVIFRDDPSGVIAQYIQDVQTGKLKLSDDPPDEVLNLIKTSTPSDFNNSSNLEWRYIILAGVVWRIEEAPTGYMAQSAEEATVLERMGPLYHH